jgi:hypothetical protein
LVADSLNKHDRTRDVCRPGTRRARSHGQA